MWKFKGEDLNDESVPTTAIGFIYLITQKSTGKKYIGRKLLTKSGSKTVKGVKKKIRKESDWKEYWSSSPKILEWIAAHGTDDFEKEILQFVSSKGMLVYAEEFAIYAAGALESDNWWNDNIRSKVYRTWCKPNEAKELRETMKALSLI